MKIVDCFIFYNEIKLLQFRMNYLYDYVDHFVLVESSLTHSGNPKPFYFEENKHLFERYLDKIVHIKVYDDIKPLFKLAYMKYNNQISKDKQCMNRGNFQRNCIERGILQLNLQDTDLIISGDADEFVDRNLLSKLRKINVLNTHGVRQDLYYYNLTCKSTLSWDLVRIIPYRVYLLNRDLAHIRSILPKPPMFDNGGWHFSYFGNIDFIIDKIKQSADQSMNKEEYLNSEFIKSQIEKGEDVFGRFFVEFQKIPIEQNNYLPDGYEFLN
jgi:beta-1,4-mannosyl-glycoprotein beta-1,4-N-acetylglucosaminyltransferase